MSVRRPYQPAGSGRFLGLLAAAVVAIPIVIGVLLLTEFDILLDNGDDDAEAFSAPALATGGSDVVEPTLTLSPEVGEPPADLAPQVEEEEEAAPDEEVYIVIPGDTLAGIARRFDTSVAALSAFNGIANPNALRIGQEIRIPPEDFTPPPPAATTPSEPVPRTEEAIEPASPAEEETADETADEAAPAADPTP